MKVSCLLVSHNKPDYCCEAIESVLNQTHTNWELLIIDSGILLNQGYFIEYTDSRIKIIPSGETEEMRNTKAMAPWCFNELFRRGLVTGNLIEYLSDDDLLYSNAFEVFSEWATNNQKIMAMYGSIDLAVCPEKQKSIIYGYRKALEISGRGAYKSDCRVDGLQLCHRVEVLDHFNTDEYWSEGKDTEHHVDGVFMEKLGEICYIYPIPVKIGMNRRTPESTYYPLR